MKLSSDANEIRRLRRVIAGIHRWEGRNVQQSPPCWLLVDGKWILNPEVTVIDEGKGCEMEIPVACEDCQKVAEEEA